MGTRSGLPRNRIFLEYQIDVYITGSPESIVKCSNDGIPDPLLVSSNVTIVGPGSDLLTIDANEGGHAFRINYGETVSISDLAVKNASVAGILSYGTLSLDQVEVSNNAGRGIINSADTLTVTNSLIAENEHSGIMNSWQGTLELTDSTIEKNETSSVGGGVANFGGVVTILRSTIADNSAAVGGGIYSSNGNVNKTFNVIDVSVPQTPVRRSAVTHLAANQRLKLTAC